MRLDATTRRPASSSNRLTAPVKLRREAPGLLIEPVRVTAMGSSLNALGGKVARAPSGGLAHAQGSQLFDPPAGFLLEVAASYVLAVVELAPHRAKRRGLLLAEQDDHAVEG